MDDKEIDFIAKRYRSGLFSEDRGWNRLNVHTGVRWRRFKIAAAITSVILISATAALIYQQYTLKSERETVEEQFIQVTPTNVIKVIDFENASLPEVISRIKEVYGVDVINLPENADTFYLSLHYEGNVLTLVDTINEILETQMTVRE